MSVILKFDNFTPINKVEKTYLNADAAVNATAITIKSTQGITTNLFALIGAPATENVELRQITAISGANLTVAALIREHKKYTDVLVLNADRIQVYRAPNVDGTTPADAAFAKLGGAVAIDSDQLTTSYTDSDGSSGYWYKYTFYNSATLAESKLANSDAVRGGNLTDYASVRDIREEAGITNNPYISDVYVAGQRSRAQSVLNAALKGNYTVPFAAPVPGIIERMTILLTAGYILKREYGGGALGTNADGQAKIDEVMRTDEDNPGLLQQILNGTLQVVDSTGASSGTRIHVSGWPNSTTKDTPTSEGGSTRKFRAGMRF